MLKEAKLSVLMNVEKHVEEFSESQNGNTKLLEVYKSNNSSRVNLTKRLSDDIHNSPAKKLPKKRNERLLVK